MNSVSAMSFRNFASIKAASRPPQALHFAQSKRPASVEGTKRTPLTRLARWSAGLGALALLAAGNSYRPPADTIATAYEYHMDGRIKVPKAYLTKEGHIIHPLLRLPIGSVSADDDTPLGSASFTGDKSKMSYTARSTPVPFNVPDPTPETPAASIEEAKMRAGVGTFFRSFDGDIGAGYANGRFAPAIAVASVGHVDAESGNVYRIPYKEGEKEPVLLGTITSNGEVPPAMLAAFGTWFLDS